VFTSVVSAQGQKPPAQPDHSPKSPLGWPARWFASQHPAAFQVLVENLAGELGITPEDFKARVKAGETPLEIAVSEGLSPEEYHALVKQILLDFIDRALTEGKITDEQADELRKHVNEGFTFADILHNLPGDRFLFPALAEELGLSWEELQQRLEAGESWPEIFQELDIKQEDIREALKNLGMDITEKAQESDLLNPRQAHRLQESGPLAPFRWLRRGMNALKDFRQKLFTPSTP
jgi:DNA-directed RNA polymerase subunit N (RpoN/RPB10)